MDHPRLPLLLALVVCTAASGEVDMTRWVRLTTPHFELYTSAGEKSGREAILYFEQVRGFFLKASLVRFPSEFPVRIIAFRNRDEFASYTPNAIAVAYFTGGARRDYIVMADSSRDSYAIAVHEYMHLVIRRSGLHIPVWLNEGLADVYSTLKPVREGVAVGDLIPARMQSLAPPAPWLDFQTLTTIDTRSKAYDEIERAGVFYGESWALTHMLSLAPDYSAAFPKFVNALNHGKDSAEACQIAWGKPSSQVFEDLRSYFGRKKIYGRIFKTTLDKAEEKTESAALSPFDARLMLADLLTSINKPDRAKKEYEELEALEPRRSEVTESLGYLALGARDTQSALQYFEKAFAAGSSDAQMCLRLALLERSAKQPAAKILAPLERAVASNPGYTEAQVQLGLMRVEAREFEPAIQTLMGIENVTPDQATPLFGALAYAYLQKGDIEDARQNAATAKKWARNPAEIKGVDNLLGFIEARAKGPFAPRLGEKTERVEGLLQGLDCSAGGPFLRLGAGGQNMSFHLPEPKAVEFSHEGGGTLQLSCGPHEPLRLRIEYAPLGIGPSSNVDKAAGVVRRIEY